MFIYLYRPLNTNVMIHIKMYLSSIQRLLQSTAWLWHSSAMKLVLIWLPLESRVYEQLSVKVHGALLRFENLWKGFILFSIMCLNFVYGMKSIHTYNKVILFFNKVTVLWKLSLIYQAVQKQLTSWATYLMLLKGKIEYFKWKGFPQHKLYSKGLIGNSSMKNRKHYVALPVNREKF